MSRIRASIPLFAQYFPLLDFISQNNFCHQRQIVYIPSVQHTPLHHLIFLDQPRSSVLPSSSYVVWRNCTSKTVENERAVQSRTRHEPHRTVVDIYTVYTNNDIACALVAHFSISCGGGRDCVGHIHVYIYIYSSGKCLIASYVSKNRAHIHLCVFNCDSE